MSLNKRKRGFSIIQSLVGIVILGMTAAAFWEFMNFAGKSQKNVQNAVDFDILKTSINLVLNTKACDGAFVPLSGSNVQFTYASTVAPGTNILTTPLPIKSIVQGSSPIVDITNPFLGGGMNLTKLEFTDAIFDGQQTVAGVVYDAFVATLFVEAHKQQGSMGKASFDKKFSARLLLSANAVGGFVEKCSPPSQAAGLTIVQTFLSNTTWTIPAGITAVKATLLGGGGAGAGSYGGGWGGAGGAGAYLQTVLLGLVPGNSLTLQIGAGGVPVSAAAGGSGGATKILSGTTTLAHVGGGAGGILPSSLTSPAAGAGGVVIAGSGLRIPGASGFHFRPLDTNNGGMLTGAGASSPLGTGGGPVPCLPKDWGSSDYTNSPGQDAHGYGAGGSGSVSCGSLGAPMTGGRGSPGIIILEY